jgi:hypothetical protein
VKGEASVRGIGWELRAVRRPSPAAVPGAQNEGLSGYGIEYLPKVITDFSYGYDLAKSPAKRNAAVAASLGSFTYMHPGSNVMCGSGHHWPCRPFVCEAAIIGGGLFGSVIGGWFA